jgi:hypothetical protein
MSGWQIATAWRKRGGGAKRNSDSDGRKKP